MQAAPLPAIDLLHPLSAFFPTAAPPVLDEEELAGVALPEPYRRLLVHDRDMTSTLEGFFGERLVLRLLARRRAGEALFRRVALVGENTGRAVEYGAIKIHLNAFPREPRGEILEGRRPLGAILARHQVAYHSAPQAFLRLRAGGEIHDLFGLESPAVLYGRQNTLRAPNGQLLAEVIEILPPLLEGVEGC